MKLEPHARPPTPPLRAIAPPPGLLAALVLSLVPALTAPARGPELPSATGPTTRGAVPGSPTPDERLALYRQALEFPDLVRGGTVTPHWLPDGSRFWYEVDAAGGEGDAKTVVYRVDPATGAKERLSGPPDLEEPLPEPRVIRESLFPGFPPIREIPSPDGRRFLTEKDHDLWVRTVAPGELLFTTAERAFGAIRLRAADPATGAVRTVIEERSETFVKNLSLRPEWTALATLLPESRRPLHALRASGLRQRSPLKRLKSASVECSSAWYSIAKAARWASVVRLPAVPARPKRSNRVSA